MSIQNKVSDYFTLLFTSSQAINYRSQMTKVRIFFCNSGKTESDWQRPSGILWRGVSWFPTQGLSLNILLVPVPALSEKISYLVIKVLHFMTVQRQLFSEWTCQSSLSFVQCDNKSYFVQCANTRIMVLIFTLQRYLSCSQFKRGKTYNFSLVFLKERLHEKQAF